MSCCYAVRCVVLSVVLRSVAYYNNNSFPFHSTREFNQQIKCLRTLVYEFLYKSVYNSVENYSDDVNKSVLIK